jgi:hypothetical protein
MTAHGHPPVLGQTKPGGSGWLGAMLIACGARRRSAGAQRSMWSPETVAQKIAANPSALGATRFDLKYELEACRTKRC